MHFYYKKILRKTGLSLAAVLLVMMTFVPSYAVYADERRGDTRSDSSNSRSSERSTEVRSESRSEQTRSSESSSSNRKSTSLRPTTNSSSVSSRPVFDKIIREQFAESKMENIEKKLPYTQGEVLVKFRKNKINLKQVTGIKDANTFSNLRNLENKRNIRNSNISIMKTTGDESVEQLIDRLKSDANVEYVEPNYVHPWSANVPDDTAFGSLWGMNNDGDTDIDAPEAWDIFTGSSDMVVAVLDSGVGYNHPDLKANMWDGTDCKDQFGSQSTCPFHGWDFINDDNNPVDDHGHGTHVAGTIGAVGNNASGVVGVNWDVQMMALKVGDVLGAVTGDIVSAIDFAIENDVYIINASFGGYSFSQAEYDAISKFQDFGGLFVTAAGNFGIDNEVMPYYPCSYDLDNIICVAATDETDDLAYFSNYGFNSVDVAAPGQSILSTIVFPKIELDESFRNGLPAGFESNGDWDFTTDNGLWSDITFPYSPNSHFTLQSPTMDLSGVDTASVRFSSICDTEYTDPAGESDYMVLDLAKDGINFDYELARLNSYSILNSFANATEFSLTIPDDYFTDNLKLRISWISDGDDDFGDFGSGCLIADMRLASSEDGLSGQNYYSSGTSMAAPHVAGLAALIKGYNPELTSAEIKEIIVSSVDPIVALEGDVLYEGRINAHSALLAAEGSHIVSGYLFFGEEVLGDVSISLEDSQGLEVANTLTDENGFYQFEDVPTGEDYSVIASLVNDDTSEGINIADAFVIKASIGNEELVFGDDGYKCIAADVNQDGTTIIDDAFFAKAYAGRGDLMTALLLPQWLFFEDVLGLSCSDSVPGTVLNIENLSTDSEDNNFRAVRVGDVFDDSAPLN